MSVFRNRDDGTILILRNGIEKVTHVVVGVGRFMEIPTARVNEASKEILHAISGFPWPDTEPRCQKFHKAHDHVLIWEDKRSDPVLRVTAMVPKGGGAMGDPQNNRVLRMPVTESELMDAVLAVMEPLPSATKRRKAK